MRAACALLLLTAACGGQDDRPTTAATSTTVAATTTTKPPPAAAELAWIEGVTALRKRLEERTALQSGVVLTQAKLREFIDARDWMAVGDPDEIQKHLTAATEHRGNGQNWLLMAESQTQDALG